MPLKTVVYLDVLLAVNFLIAAFLLSGAGQLAGAQCKKKRIVLGALVSACCSCTLLAPQLPFLLQLASKALGAVLSVWAAFPGSGVRGLLRITAWYLLLNLMLAGIVTWYILNGRSDKVHINNLSVYINLSPVVLVLCVCFIYAFLQLVIWCLGRPEAAQQHPLYGRLLNCDISVQAFYDTGLHLRDPITDGPCVIFSFGAIGKYLPQAFAEYLKVYFNGGAAVPQPEWNLRLICCNTAAGNGL